jgi:hypothetical protein
VFVLSGRRNNLSLWTRIGRPLTYAQLPMARPQFSARYRLKPGISLTLRCAIAQLFAPSRPALLPALTWIQILRKT